MHNIYKQGNLPYLNVKLCPKCEQLVDLNIESCPHCNHNFTFKSMINTLPKVKKQQPKVEEVKPVEKSYVSSEPVIATKTIQEEVATANEVKEEPVKKEKTLFCDNCGAKIIGTQKYCGGCGARVSKRICPSCDQIVDSNLIFCPLCGERLQESVSNVTTSETPVSNQHTPTYNGQPINIFLNPNNNTVTTSEDTKPVEQEQPKTEEVPVEETATTSAEEVQENASFEGINMGRKRLFLVIQILLVGVIAAIMVMIPIITNSNFFASFISCITGENSSEKMINGLGIYEYIVESITNNTINLGSSSIIYERISNNGVMIFTGIPFIYKLLEIISSNPQSLSVAVSTAVVLFVYLLLVLSLLIAFLTGIVGMFRKKPYRGKTLGFVLISLILACLLIFSSTFFAEFNGGKNCDSWLIYAFAITFFIWFVVKLVFGKEARLYKKHKEEEKLKEEIK